MDPYAFGKMKPARVLHWRMGLCYDCIWVYTGTTETFDKANLVQVCLQCTGLTFATVNNKVQQSQQCMSEPTWDSMTSKHH